MRKIDFLAKQQSLWRIIVVMRICASPKHRKFIKVEHADSWKAHSKLGAFDSQHLPLTHFKHTHNIFLQRIQKQVRACIFLYSSCKQDGVHQPKTNVQQTLHRQEFYSILHFMLAAVPIIPLDRPVAPFIQQLLQYQGVPRERHGCGHAKEALH